MNNNIIETHNLTRRFGRNEAVQNLSIKVPRGSIYAYLGPNGAGKTTTIKLLMNIIEPTSGSSAVLGVNSKHLTPKEFIQIGYVAEDQKMPRWMTVGRFLNYCKPMYPTWDDSFCEKLLKQFDLPKDQKIKNLSRGMRMKAALLSALAYRPKLLFLDEPFSGLDPLVRDEFIRGVLELTEQEQWTVFVSSHDIDEVERLADWVGIINNGMLQQAEPVSSLQERFRKIELVVQDLERLPASLPTSWLIPEKAAHTVRFVDNTYEKSKTEETIRSVFPSCTQISASPMSLREIFLTLARTYRLTSEEGAR